MTKACHAISGSSGSCLFTIGDGPHTFGEYMFKHEFSEFFGLTEFRGENSLSSFRPIFICALKRTHRFVFAELTDTELTEFALSKQYSRNRILQCSFVYPYPSVSALAGGNSDHGPRKTRTKTQTTPGSVFIGARRNSDHGLSFWGGKTQTMV